MKTIIAGSRGITDRRLVFHVIDECPWPITEVVCGLARGVDLLGSNWAALHNVPVKFFNPDWQLFGKRAGAVRNYAMAEYAEALICIHRNTPGSLDMLEKARKRGLRILERVIE